MRGFNERFILCEGEDNNMSGVKMDGGESQ